MQNSTGKNIKRVLFDIFIFAITVFVFANGIYSELSNPIQLVILKMLLVSWGGVHAHIMGKVLFPMIDWNKTTHNQTGAFYARCILYIVIPICYAFGG